MTARTTGLPIAGHLAGIARTTAALFSAWRQRRRTRRQLARLDAHQLRDIGIAETDRRQECAKRFWQP